MKKNLVSILILALLVVNLVLTSVLMFATMGSVKKTSALVTNIAGVLNIELEGSKDDGGETEVKVEMVDTEFHDIPGDGTDLTIALKKGEDGKDHYALVSATLWVNTKHEDYSTFGASISDSAIKSIIIDVISAHTIDDMKDPTTKDAVLGEILTQIQNTYDSTFIYKVVLNKALYQ